MAGWRHQVQNEKRGLSSLGLASRFPPAPSTWPQDSAGRHSRAELVLVALAAAAAAAAVCSSWSILRRRQAGWVSPWSPSQVGKDVVWQACGGLRESG